MSLNVVGADHPNKRGPTRRFEIALCKAGEPMKLVPEPKNPHDERAVAVFSQRDVQIGYLTAERCGMVGQWIARKRQVRAIFQEKTQYGAVIRVAIDGDEPKLPPPSRESARPDSDFWADPIYDDE